MQVQEFAQWESYRRERAERQAAVRKAVYQRTRQPQASGQTQQAQASGQTQQAQASGWAQQAEKPNQPQKEASVREQEAKEKAGAGQQDAAATLELRTNTSYSFGYKNSITVDPRFLQRMWQDPELRKEYEGYFKELQKMAEREKERYKRAGYEVIGRGFIVDKDGGISSWVMVRTAKKKKGFLEKLSERNKKLREKAKKKRKEQMQKEAKKALAALQKRFPEMSMAAGEKLDWKAKEKKQHVTVHSDVLTELAVKEELYKKYIGKLTSIEAMFRLADSMAALHNGRLDRSLAHLDADGDVLGGSVTVFGEKSEELLRKRAVKNAKEDIAEQKKEKKREIKELDETFNKERKKQSRI